MILTLGRNQKEPYCVLGALLAPALALHTLELPWLPDPDYVGGTPEKSCVPAGTYSLVRHDTIAHPQTWALVNHSLGVYHNPEDVPPGCNGRTDVLLHCGNDAADSRGCLLVGRSRLISGGQWIVAGSRLAFGDLKAVVPWTDDHTLIIEDVAQ